MDLTVLFFLTSGLLLGWSLGANDAANVFGTAVGTRMVRFGTAAVVCSVFVVLGAVISGAGAARTLGALSSVNALAGSFMAALSAAGTVYFMTRWGLPVSTSQAISVLEELNTKGVDTTELETLEGREFPSASEFMQAVDDAGYRGSASGRTLREAASLNHIFVDPEKFSSLDRDWLSPVQISAIERLEGREYSHRWQLARALVTQSPQWSMKENSKIHRLYNREIGRKLGYLYRTFSGFPGRR